MIRRPLSWVVLLCFLLVLSPTCYGAEITADEQLRLETIFQQLQTNYQIQLQTYAALKTDLMADKQKLEEYRLASEKLQTQLAELSQQSKLVRLDIEIAQASLQKANESFKAYEKEKKKEVASLKLQRLVLGIAVVYFAATGHR